MGATVVSTGDVVLAAGEPSRYGAPRQPTDPVGDVVLRTAGVEQLRAKASGVLLRTNSVLVHQDGHDAADIPAGTVVVEIDAYGNVLLGPNTLVTSRSGNILSNNCIPDFMYQQETRRLYTRSLILTEVGDPVDLAIGRAGPDNSYPNNAGLGITGITSGTSLGMISWRGTCTPDGGTPGVTTGAHFHQPSASIYARASEDNITVGANFHQGGEFLVQTTPNGGSTLVDALAIRNDGVVDALRGPLQLSEIADPAAPAANQGRLYLRDNGAGKSELCVRFPTGAVQVIKTEL